MKSRFWSGERRMRPHVDPRPSCNDRLAVVHVNHGDLRMLAAPAAHEHQARIVGLNVIRVVCDRGGPPDFQTRRVDFDDLALLDCT